MLRLNFLVLFIMVLSSRAWPQAELHYYMPQGYAYNEQIPTPQDILGHEVGEWHVSHDKLTYYFYELAEASERVKTEKIGETYEKCLFFI